jgi:hypothetical protein
MAVPSRRSQAPLLVLGSLDRQPVRAWKLLAEAWLDLACAGGVVSVVLLNYLLVTSGPPTVPPNPSVVMGFAAALATSLSLSVVGGTGGVLARRGYARAARRAGWAPCPQPIRVVGGFTAALIGVSVLALLSFSL